MPAPFFIVGPTAVGKTALAVAAAERCGAEIVSADAFQVYAGLDALTAKPSADEQARVRHHLIGRVPQSEMYNVARFHQEATACMGEIAARGRPVIVVGGSGLYVKALTHGLSPLPPAQPELRAELERTELTALVERLKALDAVAAGVMDLCNKRRVVRALEVCLTTGRPFSEQHVHWRVTRPAVRGVFLHRDKADLLERIDRRTAALLEGPALGEVQAALETPLSETAARIIGLRETGALLKGDLGRDVCRERLRTATWRYAKRQMTWFRGEAFEDTVNLTRHPDFRACAEMVAGRIDAHHRADASGETNP